MHIKGGPQGQKGNPLDRSDEGVFISKINSVGAARRDGRLRVGMRLIEVNGRSLLGATHQEAVNALRCVLLSNFLISPRLTFHEITTVEVIIIFWLQILWGRYTSRGMQRIRQIRGRQSGCRRAVDQGWIRQQ